MFLSDTNYAHEEDGNYRMYTNLITTMSSNYIGDVLTGIQSGRGLKRQQL